MSKGLCLVFVGLLLLIIGGCAVKLTPAGAMVREVEPAMRAACEFLAVVEAGDKASQILASIAAGSTGIAEGATAGARVGSMASGSNSKMLRRLRNEVGELGGDAFVVVGGDRFELQAEAYRCAALER